MAIAEPEPSTQWKCSDPSTTMVQLLAKIPMSKTFSQPYHSPIGMQQELDLNLCLIMMSWVLYSNTITADNANAKVLSTIFSSTLIGPEPLTQWWWGDCSYHCVTPGGKNPRSKSYPPFSHPHSNGYCWTWALNSMKMQWSFYHCGTTTCPNPNVKIFPTLLLSNCYAARAGLEPLPYHDETSALQQYSNCW